MANITVVCGQPLQNSEPAVVPIELISELGVISCQLQSYDDEDASTGESPVDEMTLICEEIECTPRVRLNCRFDLQYFKTQTEYSNFFLGRFDLEGVNFPLIYPVFQDPVADVAGTEFSCTDSEKELIIDKVLEFQKTQPLPALENQITRYLNQMRSHLNRLYACPEFCADGVVNIDFSNINLPTSPPSGGTPTEDRAPSPEEVEQQKVEVIEQELRNKEINETDPAISDLGNLGEPNVPLPGSPSDGTTDPSPLDDAGSNEFADVTQEGVLAGVDNTVVLPGLTGGGGGFELGGGLDGGGEGDGVGGGGVIVDIGETNAATGGALAGAGGGTLLFGGGATAEADQAGTGDSSSGTGTAVAPGAGPSTNF